MKSTTQLREEVLSGMEPYFSGLGFKRKKNDQAWRKRQHAETWRVVHCNFGLYEKDRRISLIPTLEVRHESIEQLKVAAGILAQPSSDTASFGIPLTRFRDGRPYWASIDDGPEKIVAALVPDLSRHSASVFQNLEDLDWVLKNLSGEDSKEWCVPSASHRVRLLPLIWHLKGDDQKAVDELRRLKDELRLRDQMIPRMRQFEEWFVGFVKG